MEMNKINNNNLEALKIFYSAKQAKKAETEEKQQEHVEGAKEFEPKKVQASALEALAAQNLGAQLSKVDTSDAAVEKRLSEAIANSPFMKALDDIFEDENDVDFVKFAFANIKGADQDKLAKYLEKGLSIETEGKIRQVTDSLTL